MLTPQEAESHVFPKASFGGYNMLQVDNFLDSLIEDYRTLYQENISLKNKMKVLVDKVEEYRATEDAMRMTLHSAQKMADALVAALHGQVVKLATNSKDYLNPMDIQLSHKGDKEALKLKSDFIITLCDLIAGGKDGLENDEKGIIDECIRHIYDKYFENPVPENMPLLEDLYDALLAHKNPKAERIANSLVLYVHGSQNYFNHHTNVDSGNRIMCFDIRDLGNQLKELGMLIVQDAVWNRVSQNRERKIATRYYCDEFHLLLKEKQTAIYSVEIWKRFRKWGGIPTGLTQNVGDFLRSEEIEGILGNSDFVYLLNQNAKDQAILADKLGLSDKQLSYVTNSEPGSGLILFDNVVIPFVDKYPTDTKTYRIMNTKPEESVQKEDAV